MPKLEVRVIQARNLPEGFTKPDPYVKVKLGLDQKFKTSTRDSTTSPTWEELFKFHVSDEATQQLRFTLKNSNRIKDDFLGGYTLSIAGLQRGVLEEKWLLLADAEKGQPEIKVAIRAVDFGMEPHGPSSLQPPPSPMAPGGSPHTTPLAAPPSNYGAGGSYGAGPSQPGYNHPPPPGPPGPPAPGPPPPGGYQGHPQQGYPQQPPHGSYPPQHHPQSYPPGGPGYPHGPPQQPPHGSYPPGGPGYPAGPPHGPPPHGGPGYPPPGPIGPPGGWPQPGGPGGPGFSVPAPAPPPDTRPPWERLGILQKEYDHMAALFVTFDESSTGALNPAELGKLARYMNFARDEQDIVRMFTDMDRNRTGRLTLEEFVTWMAQHRPNPHLMYGMDQVTYHQVTVAFRTVDKNLDGQLQLEEFAALCYSERWARTEGEVRALFGNVDTRNTGVVSLHELLQYRGRHGGMNAAGGAVGATGTSGLSTSDANAVERLRNFFPELTPDRALQLLRQNNMDVERAGAAAAGGQQAPVPTAGNTPQEREAVQRLKLFFPTLSNQRALELLRRHDGNVERAAEDALQ